MRKFLFMFFALLFSSAMFGQLSGTFSIPGDYATLRAAFTALNSQGVGGSGATFNVAAGYTETSADSLILTASGRANGYLVFQKNGAGNNPLVSRTGAGNRATTTLGGQGDAVIILQGCDYVTFNGIDITTSDQGIEYGYYLRKANANDGCKYVIIMNSQVTLTRGTSAYVAGIYSSNNDAASLVSSNAGILVQSVDGRNEHVTIKGNTIGNVTTGILLRGYNHLSPPYDYYDQNFVIGASGAGNIIQNYGGTSATAYGIYAQNHANLTISDNSLDNAGGGGSNGATTLYGIYYAYATTNPAGGDLVISNNHLTINQGASSSTYAIYTNQNCSSSTITSNTFGYGTFASGTAYIIYANSNTSNVTVSYNSTTGNVNKTGSGTLYCYYNLGGPVGGTEILSNNNFSNITVAGTSGFYGIYSGTSATQNKEIFSNTISNIACGSGTFYGINSTYGLTANIFQNQINTVTAGGTIYGIASGGTSSVTHNTHHNNIHGLSTIGTSSVVYGISAATAPNNNLYGNTIYDLTAGGYTTTAAVYGLNGTSGTNLQFYNNFISDLKAPAATGTNAVVGINLPAAANASVFYNTVFLNASSSGATFGSSALYAVSTANLDLRNNILVNQSNHNGNTGYTVAFRRNNAITGTNYLATSNTNDLYASSGSGILNWLFYDGTSGKDSTMTQFKARVAPRDAGSFSEDPPFMNKTTAPYNLHMQPVQTKCESGGTPVIDPVAVNDDIDGNPRYPNPGYPDNILYPASAPDVGADEFAGQPTFTCELPNPGNTMSTADNICFGESVTLSLQNPVVGTGNSYQWQESADNITYINIPDANLSLLTVTPTADTWYRCVVTCQNGPVSASSVPFPLSFTYAVTSSAGASRCGTGTVKLNATGSGVQLGWYATVAGGNALGYGSEFTTPTISETTTFYVGAESSAPGVVTIGSGTSTSATYSNPFYSLYSNLHDQFLIPADELIASGLSAGNMTSLGINITVVGTLPMIDFSLKMGLTSATDLSSFVSTAFSTLYTSPSYMPVLGMNTMAFTTPFVWDGLSNIVIEICHGNPSSTATMSRTCLIANTPYIATVSTHATTSTGGSVICGDVTTNKLTYSYRPQFTIDGNMVCSSPRTAVVATVAPPPPVDISGDETVCNDVVVPLTILSNPASFDVYTWSPVDHLFTNPAGTVAYTGENLQTVYVRTTTAGTYTYTCSGLNSISFCANTDQATITVLPGNPQIVAVPSSLCVSGSSTLSLDIPSGYGTATFQWQVSTDGMAFSDISGATNLVYHAEYVGLTTWFRLVIKNGAGATCIMPQYELVVNNPLVTNTVPGFHCGPGTVELGATGTTGLLTWYNSPSGGTPLGTGSTFTTPYLWASQTFYVTALEPGTILESAGKITPTGTVTGLLQNYGMVFTANQDIRLQSVDVFPATTAGQLSVSLYSGTQQLLYGPLYFNFPAGDGTVPYTLPLDFQIIAGSGYRLLITTMAGGNLKRESSGVTYPISNGSLVTMTAAASSLTGSSTTSYNWFYNWRVMYGCASPLTPVLATINLAPFYVLTPDQAACNNDRATITVDNGTSYFDTFTWAPADHLFTDPACLVPYVLGVNTPSVYLKTTEYGNYEIRGYANNTVNGCTNFDTTHVAVLPAVLTILADPDTICISGPTSLTLAPAMDYGASKIQWQMSSDGIGFTDIPGATNSSYLTGDLTSTTYYKVKIKNSAYNDCLSAQLKVVVESPAILTTTPGTRCGTGTVDLGATASPGSTIKWYGSIDGGALLGTGELFTTPVISATQNFYVSAGGASGMSSSFAVPNIGQNTVYTLEAGLLFDVYAPSLILEGVYIYPVGTGEGIVNIALKNSANIVFETLSFTCTGTTAPGVKTWVPLNWTIPAGSGYYLDMTSRTGLVASLVRDPSASIVGGPIATNPYCNLDGVVKITSGRLGTSGTSTSYYYFYDWQIRTGCTSPRVPVLATVNPGNPVNVTPSRTICSGEILQLTVTSQVSDYDVYTWSPVNDLFTDAACSNAYNGENKTTLYFKSSSAVVTTYTCHGVNTLNGCNSTAVTTVTAMPNPVIASIPEAICISGTATLRLSPATGYGLATFQWQDSPDNVIFTNIAGATDPTYVTPTVTTLSYYKVIIKNSTGVTCSEPTYALDVSNPQLLSTTSGERCGPGTVELGATGSGGTINWYSDPVGGEPLGSGTSFTTPVISATTSFWAGVSAPGSTDGYVGMPASVSGTSGAGTVTYGLYFDALSAFTLRTVNVYPNSSTNNTPGTVTISVINTAGTVLHQAVVDVIGYTQSSNPNMQTVDLNFDILPESGLRLVMTAKSSGISGLMFQPSSQAPYPYPYVLPGVVSITSGTYGSVVRPELYYYFYNWRVSIGCQTPRAEVLASVNVPPVLSLSGNKTICINDVYQIDVTSPLAQFDSYTWSPVDNLFTDAACTQAYVAMTSATTVYVKAPAGGITTYTCSSSSSVPPYCTNLAGTEVTVIPAAVIGSFPDEICYSGDATLGLIPDTGYGLATFQWQDSPDNTVFTDILGATAMTYFTPVLNATRYYKMLIRNESGALCSGPVYTMKVNNPQILTTTPGTRCGIGTVQLQATATAGSVLKWYTAAVGGDPIGTGSPFTTPVITATTSFYVGAESGGGGVGSVGPVTNEIGAGGATALTYNLYFDVLANSMTLYGVYVYPGAAGDVKFYIANSSGTVLHNITYPVTSGDIGNKTFIPVNVVIPAGVGYRIGYNSTVGGVSMFRNTAGATYPYTMPGVVSITGNSFSGYPQYYYYFYDWQIITGCQSGRTAVLATVTPTPAMIVTATPSSVCAGGQSMLRAQSLNFGYTYVWSPGNLVGQTQYVHPLVSTQYSVTATDNGTGCVNIGSVTVTVKPTPSPITIDPAAPSINPGGIQQLTANGGILTGSSVFGTSTTTNTTTGYPAPYTNYYGGTKHQMLIRASELLAGGMYSGATINSVSFTVTAVGTSFPGDLNNFQIDMGHTAQTTLTSSSFVGGLTNVIPPMTQPVAVGTVTHTLAIPFVWDGTSNLVIQTSYSNGNTGTSSYSVQMTNSDPGFVSTSYYRVDGQTAATVLAAATPSGAVNARPNMVIGYGVPAAMVWSPTSELYLNAGATIPYNNESVNTVWAKPAETKTFTATASNISNGCSTAQSVLVTVLPPTIPVNLFVSDTIFSGHDTCLNATQTITVAGFGNTFVVQSDAVAIMIAGQNILYLPGTKVEESGYMHGYITTNNQYCDAPAAPVNLVNAVPDDKPFTSPGSLFSIYPNPTTGEFTIEVVGGNITGKVNVEIYSVHGNKVLKTALEGQTSYNLSLANRPAGIYFVRMISGGVTETMKVVKQ